ncbi:hypothetical protein ACWDKQ_32585 [Saccharopolyspora sp. NPDC000995]
MLAPFLLFLVSRCARDGVIIIRTVQRSGHSRTFFRLRWLDGEEWGYLSVVSKPGNSPVFLGFIHREIDFFHAVSRGCASGVGGFREVWFIGPRTQLGA